MNSRDVIRLMEAAGWQRVAAKGSHWQFKHSARAGRVTAPHPKRDLPVGTLRSIKRQSDLQLR